MTQQPSNQATQELLLLQLRQHQLCHRLQRVEHAGPIHRHGLEGRLTLHVELAVHLLRGNSGGQVALVHLQDVRNCPQIVALLFKILLQVLQRFSVRFHPGVLRISDETDAIDALQNQLARCVVENLPWHGVEMESRLEAPDLAKVEGKKIEEEGAIGLRGQRDQLSLRLRVGFVVDPLQIGRLSAKARPVVDDLAVDLTRRVIDKRHLLFAEEAVDIFVSDLGERRIEAICGGATVRFRLFQKLLERPLQFLRCFLHAQANQTERRAVVEYDDQDDPLSNQRNVDVVAFSFVKEDGELFFSDELCQSVGGRDVAGGERGQGSGVDVAHVAVGGDLLAILVDQKNNLGVGVDLQTLKRFLDLPVLLLVHHEIRSCHLCSPY